MRPPLTKHGRIKVNVIWSLTYFYTNILREYSLRIVNAMNIYLLCNFNIVDFVLKTDRGGEGDKRVGVQKPLFCYFLFWGALIVGRWDAVGLGRKSYWGQAEIACFCLFRDVRVSTGFPWVTSRVERFSLDLCRAVNRCRKCVLEVSETPCFSKQYFRLFS